MRDPNTVKKSVVDKNAGASEGYTSGTHRVTYAKRQVIIRESGLTCRLY